MTARCGRDARTTCAPFSRLENEAVLDRMAERLKKRPEVLDRRREIVEHPFGSIKQWMYQGAFLMRGLANVRAEFSLTALAYNLRRALNILGVEAMTTRRRGLRRCGSSARVRAPGRSPGRTRRPIARKPPELLPAHFLCHSIPKSWSFRTVCKFLAPRVRPQ